MLLGFVFALMALVIDQLTKWYIATMFLKDVPFKTLGSFFNIREAWNTGVSFSLFDNGGYWGTIALIVFALGVVVFLLHWLYHEENKVVQVALGLIIGGALGNVIDRIRFGAVYDFLDFHYADWHWPAFNAADTFICIGAFLIIFHSLCGLRKNSLKEIVK